MDFQDILNRSKTIMQETATPQSMRGNAMSYMPESSGYNPRDERDDFGYNETPLDTNLCDLTDAPGYVPPQMETQMQTPAMVAESKSYGGGYNPNAVAQSKMPKAILESMMSNPINMEAPKQVGIETLLQKNGVLEAMNKYGNVPARPQNNSSNGGAPIDYSIIKMIINECLEEKLNKLNLLSENTIKNIQLKEGKINLVDNKGNIYGAELKFKGNVNDKKK